jgi:hypothetical protein
VRQRRCILPLRLRAAWGTSQRPQMTQASDRQPGNETGEPALILGLGNPGAVYSRHRHNVGFRVVEALARAHGLTFSRSKGKARLLRGGSGGTVWFSPSPRPS